MSEIDQAWLESGARIRALDANRNQIRIMLEHTPRWRFRRRRKLEQEWLRNTEYRQVILKASTEEMNQAVHSSIQDKTLEHYTEDELLAEIAKRRQ